jgi:hypothetical protein
MKVLQDIKNNWKELVIPPIVTFSITLVLCAVIFLGYNFLVWVTPNECHEYISMYEMLIRTLGMLLIVTTILITLYTSLLLSYPLSWIDSKLPSVTPERVKRYLAARKEKALAKNKEKELKQQNKPPNWFQRNESNIMLSMCLIAILFFFVMGIMELVKFYYCL